MSLNSFRQKAERLYRSAKQENNIATGNHTYTLFDAGESIDVAMRITPFGEGWLHVNHNSGRPYTPEPIYKEKDRPMPSYVEDDLNWFAGRFG